MEIGTVQLILGTSILAAIAAFFAITTNFFNIRDRFKKWRSERKKAKYKKTFFENNPDFEFSLNYLSNPQPGKCILYANLLNISKEIKYIESFEYKFEDPKNPTKIEPSQMFINGEKWPKRLEHGERVAISTDFSMTLPNVAFQYWKKDYQVYCTSKTSTGDFLRSNKIDFDVLVNFLEPINERYKGLAVSLSKKTGGLHRDIEISLWELQIFNRLTVHIVKQLQHNSIPIVEYLIDKHGLIVQEDIWSHWYRDLEHRKIQPIVVEEFLMSLL